MAAVHHAALHPSGITLDTFTDEEAGLRMIVNRQGAELISLARRAGDGTDGSWIGFLYRDGQPGPPASGWGNHATVMGYYLHRLRDGRSRYRGTEIRGGNHSFLREKCFAAPVVGENSLTYQLEPAQIAPTEYPLQVAFALTYALERDGLRVTFAFENREPERTAHVSFGLHPGFAATSLASADVLLPAGRYRRLLAPGNFLSGATETIEHGGGPMPFAKSDLPGSFLLDLAEIEPRACTFLDRASGRRVELNLSETPYLTLWSDGGDFICVEPCWGLPDHQEQRPFEEKLGIQTIAPGGRLRRSFSMQPLT